MSFHLYRALSEPVQPACLPRPPMSELTQLILILHEMSCALNQRFQSENCELSLSPRFVHKSEVPRNCFGLSVKPVMTEAATAGWHCTSQTQISKRERKCCAPHTI